MNLLRKETLNKLDFPKLSKQNDCFELELTISTNTRTRHLINNKASYPKRDMYFRHIQRVWNPEKKKKIR